MFARVESKANVADAVSRADLTRARHEGWQRTDDNVDQVVGILARAASNSEEPPSYMFLVSRILRIEESYVFARIDKKCKCSAKSLAG